MRYQQNLKKIREQHKYSQKEVADMLCTSQQQYSRWENGEFQMPIETYKALADIYETSIDELCNSKSRIEQLIEESEKPWIIPKTSKEAEEMLQKEIEEEIEKEYEEVQDRKKELKALIEQYTKELEYLEKHW